MPKSDDLLCQQRGGYADVEAGTAVEDGNGTKCPLMSFTYNVEGIRTSKFVNLNRSQLKWLCRPFEIDSFFLFPKREL